MPIYEYATETGERVELIRPMADADKPVEDPEGNGRVFKRVHSTFATAGGPSVGASGGGGGGGGGGCCPCGKGAGACSRGA